MARLIERPTFDPARPVTVRRFFVAAGRHWQPGDAFDWKRMAVAQRRVRLLFENGKLMHPDSDGGAFAPAPAPAITPPPTIEQEIEDDAIHHIAVTSEEPVTEPQDDLAGLNMVRLREIALAEDAPSRVSRDAQREAIREARRARSGE